MGATMGGPLLSAGGAAVVTGAGGAVVAGAVDGWVAGGAAVVGGVLPGPLALTELLVFVFSCP